MLSLVLGPHGNSSSQVFSSHTCGVRAVAIVRTDPSACTGETFKTPMRSKRTKFGVASMYYKPP